MEITFVVQMKDNEGEFNYEIKASDRNIAQAKAKDAFPWSEIIYIYSKV